MTASNRDHGDSETTPLLREQANEELSWRIRLGIGMTWIAAFLAALDSTVTSTISSAIATEFESLTIISWLGSSYLIALTATQPLSGKLSDIFGRRNSFIAASTMFAAGNLICGLTKSQPILILGRVMAGIGGGASASISTFVASDHIPLRSRGLWQGMGSVVYVSGLCLGGVIGGALNDTWGWRWGFLILVPSSIISGLGVAILLPESASMEQGLKEQLQRIDFLGSFTLVLSLVLFLIGLNHEDQGPSTSGAVLGIVLSLAAIFFGLFVLIEWRYAKEPVVSLSLLGTRTVLASCLAAWFSAMMLYTLMFYVPIYLQLLGASTSETGVQLLPDPIGGGIGSLAAGLIMRVTGGYGTLNIVAPILSVLGSAGMATSTLKTPYILTASYLFIKGLGFGGRQTIFLLAVLSSVSYEQHATATSIMYAFRSTGSTIGLSASSAMFRIRLDRLLEARATASGVGETLPDSLEDALHCLPDGHDDCYHLKDIYMSSLHSVFLLALGFAGCSLLAGLFMKNNPLRTSLKDNSKDDQTEDEQ